MRRIAAAAAAVWDFVAGDDWITAAGVVLALGLTSLIADRDAAWFVMPLAVGVLLPLSVWRRTRGRGGT